MQLRPSHGAVDTPHQVAEDHMARVGVAGTAPRSQMQGD